MSKTAPPELAADTLLPPDRYSLVERLGEGGMGTVWRARQRTPIARDVAVKLIKAGLDTDAVIRQFNAERHALALMDHPYIAKVFDAGRTTLGRPYFVMEFVRGEPLNRFCDGQLLSIERRLSLLADICDAVQHAHTKGVLHRDLKPGNVLVALEKDQAVPKVIDFGLAKALGPTQLTDETIATWLQRAAGTPQYMSPEQASASPLGLDTRSEVYSLAVMLYELVTGCLPIQIERSLDTTNEMILHQIATQEVIVPSVRWSALSPGASAQIADLRRTSPAEIDRLLRGDLRWVILKALRRDRTERYGSAADLARDLRNWLAGRAVMAGPDSAAYRVGKFVQRNKPAVAAAALLLVSLLAGLAGTTWQAVRATRAEHRAENQRLIAERRAVTTEAVSGFLQDMISSATPERHGGNVPSIIDVVVQAAETFHESDRFKDEPEIRAKLQTVLGYALNGLGRENLAEAMMLDALALFESMPEADPREYRELLGRLGMTLMNQGRPSDGLEVLERYMAVVRSAEDVSELDRYTAIARLGTIYGANDDLVRGQALLEEALEGFERAGAAMPARLSTASNLASILSINREHEKAEQILERYIAEAEAKRPDITMLPNLRKRLAEVHYRQQRYDESVEEFERALRRADELWGPTHPDTMNVRQNLIAALKAAGRTDEAQRVEDEWMEARQAAFDRGDIARLIPPQSKYESNYPPGSGPTTEPVESDE